MSSRSSIAGRNLAVIRRYQQGDRAAAEELLELNAGLVGKIVRHYLPVAVGLEYDDLEVFGQLGLLHAARRFDARRGCAFSTYATPWIRQAILRALSRDHLIRVPDYLLAAARRSSAETGEWPLPQVVASLDAPVGEDGGTLGDLLPDEEGSGWEEAVLAGLVAEHLLTVLSERERAVIVRRFGLRGLPESTLAEVGASIGTTRQGAAQIEARALRKLRSSWSAAWAESSCSIIGR